MYDVFINKPKRTTTAKQSNDKMMQIIKYHMKLSLEIQNYTVKMS